VHVQVRNGTVTSPAWNGDRLTYLAPSLTKLSAVTGPLAGGQRITITGARLTGASAVLFGTKLGTGLTVASATSLSVVVPSGVSGAVDVRVTTPEGTSAIVAVGRWTYTTLPLVTGVSRKILAARGGQPITVTGTNLATATELIIGTTNVPVDTTTATSATAVAPPGAGTVSVRAVSPSGTSISTDAPQVTYTSTDEHYTYNGDGLRVETTSATGQSTTVTWDPFSSTPVPLVDGTRKLIYGPDGLPIEQVESDNTPSYFVHDQLGSTRALLNAAGQLSAAYNYGPFGQLLSHTGSATTALTYAAGHQDPTGLIYLVNRYLDPATGVFLTVDPALAMTGQPYSYADGDPVNSADPTGLWPTIVMGMVLGGAFGAIGSAAVYYSTPHKPGDAGLVHTMLAGAAGGVATGACLGSGIWLVSNPMVCGAAGGAVSDYLTRGKVDGELAASAAAGAAGGFIGMGKLGAVGPEVRSSWLQFADRYAGGLKASNLWRPGPLMKRMYGKAFWDGLLGYDLEMTKNYLLRCLG
jgi:RHS repeat-associated protein